VPSVVAYLRSSICCARASHPYIGKCETIVHRLNVNYCQLQSRIFYLCHYRVLPYRRHCRTPVASAMTTPSRRSRCRPATTPRRHPDLGSRPPCLGQECSPIRRTPCGAGPAAFEPASADDPHRFHHHRCLAQAVVAGVGYDAVTAVDPPAPVVERSCQKVDRWLRRLEHDDDGVVDATKFRANVIDASCAAAATTAVVRLPVDDSDCQHHGRDDGLKRKIWSADLEPTEGTIATRICRDVIGESNRPNIPMLQRKGGSKGGHQRRRRGLVDRIRRRAHQTAVGRKSLSGSRLAQCRRWPSAASSSVATSSGWLADRSSSTVAASGECESNQRHQSQQQQPSQQHNLIRRLVVGPPSDRKTAVRRRSADRRECRRRRHLVAHRMRQCVRDVNRGAGSGLHITTLAVL
jgi:hypothetical protein